MKYSFQFSATASKSLNKILKSDKKLYVRILNAIESLAEDPIHGKSLKLDLKGRNSLRVGSYRVIYEIIKNQLIIYVIAVGHRKTIYKRK